MSLQLQPGDDEILAMCSPVGPNGPTNHQSPVANWSGSSLLNGGDSTVNPFNFNMVEGSSMVVENSELQIGTKIITNRQLNSPSNGGPFLTVDDPNNASIDLSTTPEEGLLINITKATANKNEMVAQSPNGDLTSDSIPLDTHLPLNKSASTPIPLGPNQPAKSSSVVKAPSPTTPSGGQQSFVNTTIHNGTQIVINYADAALRKGSSDTLSIEELLMHLEKFKEILIKRYEKKSRTPLLPWHIGRKVVPLDYYYQEPRIFSMDRRGGLENVNIKHLLTSNQMETRYAVEGEAGMGKTLLASRLAHSWAEGSDEQMQKFKLVLLVPLADFRDNVETYILENILPSYFDHDTFHAVWDYWRRNEKDILFILDGYDELRKSEKSKIENLISGQDFPNSKVLVTSRPATLQCHFTRFVVKGFDDMQIFRFIQKYFDDVNNSDYSGNLQSILERHSKYRKLAERPLFCVLLCMLFETDMVQKELPDRMSDILHKIMLCLIKWREIKNKELNVTPDGIPAEFEQAFDAFGKLCVRAIKEDRHRFSDEEIKSISHFEEISKLGFLYPEEVIGVVEIQTFHKPVHQIFMEYFAAVHIANHVRKCWFGCRQCWRFSSLLERQDSEVLVFTAGILGPDAYRLFDIARFPKLQKLTESKILTLLREAGPHPKNTKVVAKILDTDTGVITTNESEIEGWSYLLPEKFTYLRTLEIVWRIKSNHPDQESSFVEAGPESLSSFFNAISKNTCIQKLIFRSKQDGAVFTDEKLKIFFSSLHESLIKKGLKTLEFRDMKIELDHYLRTCFKNALNSTSLKQPGFNELKTINLKTFLSNTDLERICNVLANTAPQLETLQLHGLELGHEGFTSLASLLKKRSTLHHLYLSMNEALLVNVFGSAESDYAPQHMKSAFSQQRLRKNAAKKSHDEFALHNKKEKSVDEIHLPPTSFYYQDSNSSEDGSVGSSGRVSPLTTSTCAHPYTEFKFLFDTKNDSGGVKKVPHARHYWFIKGSETRLPLPLCMEAEHESVFHYLFSSLPHTQLRTLSLDQPGFYLTIADLVCLGDAIRSTPHLKTLDLKNLSRVKYYMPILIALAQSTSLENVNLSSDRVVVKDAALQLACCALSKNTSVRKLSLANWKFVIKEKHTALTHIKSVVNSWGVLELNLQHCSVDFTSGPKDSIAKLIFSPPIITTITPPSVQEYRTLSKINLAQVELNDGGCCRRGPLLLPHIRNFANLQQLDLSGSPSKPITVDDSSCNQAFKLIAKIQYLKDLTLKYWDIQLADTHELCLTLSQLRSLREIKLDNTNERCGRPNNCDDSFLHAVVSSLPSLKCVSICYYTLNGKRMDEAAAEQVAKCLHRHWKQYKTKVQVYGVTPHALKSLKNGLLNNFCFLRQSNSAGHILTLEVFKPVLPF